MLSAEKLIVSWNDKEPPYSMYKYLKGRKMTNRCINTTFISFVFRHNSEIG